MVMVFFHVQMDHGTKAPSKVDVPTATGSSVRPMATFTRANGNRTGLMGTANTLTKMAAHTLVNGSRTRSAARALNAGQMVLSMRANFCTVASTVLAFTSQQMAPSCMRGSSVTTEWMARALTISPMGERTPGVGTGVTWMVRATCPGLMAPHIEALTRKTFGKVREASHGRMGECTRASGSTVSRMVRGSWWMLKAWKPRVAGGKVRLSRKVRHRQAQGL
mmetsp:Transcript_102437/g.181934  ORF Transcript_102437/g.181934 Transcript_102437/m.181934 type:complete len:221 (-) Transcript_102437:109-771(-)